MGTSNQIQIDPDVFKKLVRFVRRFVEKHEKAYYYFVGGGMSWEERGCCS